MEDIQTWVSNHKLTTIGAIWASTIGASLAYNTYTRATTPLKPSLRLIHASKFECEKLSPILMGKCYDRMHAQALTLAVLSGAAAYHYYEKNSGRSKQDNTING
ncbi:hypothetical protein J1N35_029386 [Gossypium stocksii]|uniref:HIG1 domain-containing protein n=1 Tax=Gossypium stocksii TaxID=47602 RepID=A0A9D3UZZ3_9ROSI|nr:hypothetical protein J1N35_029386 [Gossypium stocksii]